MIAQLWITDGQPECFDAAAKSLYAMWRGPEPDMIVVVDDSGNPMHQAWIDVRCRAWGATIIHHRQRRGFDGAIASGWSAIAAAPVDYVFHVEHDFTYNRPVDLEAMQLVLDMQPHVAQVSLMRQAVTEAERAAGGVVASMPDAFEEYSIDLTLRDGSPTTLRWMEQRCYFTTNPSLYRGDLVAQGWPQIAESEGMFSYRLLKDGFGTVPGDAVTFGVMGAKDDEPAVTHIGVRQGTGY